MPVIKVIKVMQVMQIMEEIRWCDANIEMQIIQVLQVIRVMQAKQVMQVSLAHMWVDFRVIQLCHRLHKRISKKNNEKQENDPAVKTSNLPKAESAAQKRFAP